MHVTFISPFNFHLVATCLDDSDMFALDLHCIVWFSFIVLCCFVLCLDELCVRPPHKRVATTKGALHNK